MKPAPFANFVVATGQANPLAPSYTGQRFTATWPAAPQPLDPRRTVAYVCTSLTADEARGILAALRGMVTPAEHAAAASVRDDADPYADGGRL